MPAETPLSLLKLQLNLDHNFDDVLLDHKLQVAERWVKNHTGRPDIPLSINETEAVLQLAAYWYAQREAVSFGVTTVAVPFGVYELLRSSRWECTGRVKE